MKVLVGAAALATALAVTALSAHAHGETDRALSAGSYIHPTGSANGAWTKSAAGASYDGDLTTVTQR